MSIKQPKTIAPSSVAQESCVFCKIVSGQLPSFIVYQDDNYIAFLDAFPFSRGHTLVCPKKHGETVWDMSEEEIGGLFTVASIVSKAVVAATEADGFRFVQNNGEAANQVVPHVHIHTIPVKLSDKGKWMDRTRLPNEEMEEIAEKIRAKMKKK
ncbi:MAG: HIT family protein [archaeon]|nr:HIT family protein [archaeon]